MELILEQIKKFLENNIFLTPEVRAEIWDRIREGGPAKQLFALENLNELDKMQHSMIKSILKKDPGFFQNIAREATQKRLHSYLEKERNEHEAELQQMDQLLEATLSEI